MTNSPQVIDENQADEIGRLATLADALVYLYSATLAETWPPIYDHVAFETMIRHSLSDAGEAFEVLLTYESQPLAGPEQEKLLALRRDIRQTVVKFARQRELVWSEASRRYPLHTPSFQQLAGYHQWKYPFGRSVEQ